MGNKLIILLAWLTTPRYWFKLKPSHIYAQAWHETGAFTSNIYRENNNYFGMKQPSKRKTLVTGTNRSHGVLPSRWASVKDLFLWFDMFSHVPKLQTVTQYAEFLQSKGYAEATHYVEAMERVHAQEAQGFKTFKNVLLWLVLPLPLFVVVMVYARK